MTLQEAWEVSRQRYGDEVAQQSVFRTLRNGHVEDQGKYVLFGSHRLHRRRFHDGEEDTISWRKARMGTTDGLEIDSRYLSPETILELREEVLSWPRLRQFRVLGVRPPAPVVRCYWCHGSITIKYGKGRSGIQRYLCKSSGCGKSFDGGEI